MELDSCFWAHVASAVTMGLAMKARHRPDEAGMLMQDLLHLRQAGLLDDFGLLLFSNASTFLIPLIWRRQCAPGASRFQ